ncbi:ABC transporter permease [Clostridium sp. CF012]|uniref:ABC transporter permease n=1 Tax=Clostridium sp. CF012 TaxID=2843319 RepID=UPI001C0DC281|nr:ABC transporter permease [Clostridium sp. CF012]MBU3144008.1 ABC transporter permease [Clostridium sp. CF012]
MKEFFTVLGYTFKENLRKKSFIISTVITLILTIVIVSLPAIIKNFDNSDKNNTEQGTTTIQNKKGVVLVVDSKGILKGDLNKLGKVFSNYEFKSEPSDNIDTLKNKVKNEENNALIVLDEKNGVPTFDYIIKQSGSGLAPSEISRVIKSVFVSNLLTASNVSDNVSKMVQSEISFNVNELGKGKMNSYISSIVVSMLLFFSIYFYGYGVAMSVASEKTSRVMELLVTSTKPSKIILGKSAAMGILGLIQLAMVVFTGALTYKLTFPENFAIAGQALNFSSFTPFSLVMIIVYFIFGYSLYAMMNAVAGATVSKAEDVNSSIMPISMISMVAFYMGYFSLAVPNGNVAILSSIIPFSAPFSMPSRILATEVPIWQIIASLFSLVITIVFIAWISIKIYSSAILHYGKRLKLKDLVKMSNKQ